MKINDNTILRIKVPAHLYESVKAQLTLDEAKKVKQNFGAGMEEVKGQKATGGSSDKPKTHKSNKPKAEKSIPSDGHKKTAAPKGEKETPKEKKKLSLDDIKKVHEVLGELIAEMDKTEEAKTPVEESVILKEEDSEADRQYRDTIYFKIKKSFDPYHWDRENTEKKPVTVDGEPVVKMVPDYRYIYYGEPVKKMEFLGNKEEIDAMVDRIKIDGQPVEKPKYIPSEPKKPDPSFNWLDRFGPGGGYDTPIGRYTGD